tara:strand:+ start:5237 stop:5485 length:249 start_codon:yes stop_codon:yes gene_type:complete
MVYNSDITIEHTCDDLNSWNSGPLQEEWVFIKGFVYENDDDDSNIDWSLAKGVTELLSVNFCPMCGTKLITNWSIINKADDC